MAFLQGFKVEQFILLGLCFPTAKHHPNPCKRQGANGGMMSFSAVALHVIIGFSPDRLVNRFIGIFLKTLAQKFGTRFAPLHENGLSTSFFDRRNAHRVVHLVRAVKAIAVSAEGRE